MDETVAVQNPYEQQLDTDDTTDTACHGIFGIPLVLTEVFKNLPVSDLLNCSLVNKLWNYEARSVLRDFKKCTARTRSWLPCADLRDLNLVLQTTQNCPYNGLTLNIEDDHHETDACLIINNVTDLYASILNRIKLKNLVVNWQYYDYDGQIENTCPAVILLKTIMSSRLDQVEELHLVDFLDFSARGAYPREQIMRNKLQLLNLKLLKVYPNANLPQFLIEDLLSAAPNLQDFQIECTKATYIRNLSPQNYRVIKKLMFSAFDGSQEEFCHRFALSGPQLRHLHIGRPSVMPSSNPAGTRMNFATWIEILHLIFGSSRLTLESFHCDFVILLILMNFPDIPVFPNVNELLLTVDLLLEAEIRNRLRRFNFTKVFPKVTSVSVVVKSPREWWPEQVIDFVTFGNNNQETECVELSGSIRTLYLDASDGDTMEEHPHFIRHAVEFCGELFPNLLVLKLEAVCYRPLPYDQIWASMTNLEDITVTDFATEPNCYDAAFCGIYPKEARWLSTRSPKFIQNYHAVPIRRTITDLPRLRRLHLILKGCINRRGKRKMTYLSRVTGYLAFTRLPKVELIFENSGRLGLEAVREVQEFQHVSSTRQD